MRAGSHAQRASINGPVLLLGECVDAGVLGAELRVALGDGDWEAIVSVYIQ